MSKIDWKRKLSSRKLWAAVVGIITEGKVDAENVKKPSGEPMN